MNYKKYEKILKSMAWSWSRRTGLDFDDFLGQGNLAFVKCCKNYKKNIGRFEPYLRRSAKNSMHEYANANMSYNYDFVRYNDTIGCSKEAGPDQNFLFTEILDSLSEDAGVIVDMILNGVDELQDMFAEVETITRGTIRTYLRKLKWSHYRIDGAFSELRRCFS